MSSICIAGMHRSGTSMVSRVLNLAGLYLGADEKIMPPAPENQEGFWEHLDIVAINEEVLASIGAAWDFIPEFESGWETADALNSLYERAREILQPFEKQEFWGWKDPRNSITLPFWKHLLPDVKVILCVRHPLEVAQSLRSRNGSSIIFGLNLWYQYNLA
ncbi:MAG: sulfotransferase family protein, partial [Calditrichae bacterium]|nr:sulfotransferase family protein [Calditrichia bacterium]